MKKVLAFGGSNSSTSINKKLASYVASQLEDATVNVADLNDFELPLYSPDLEKEIGVHENAVKFSKLIEESDAIVLSLAEYNGSYTAAFKNLFDWMSRINQKVWKDKPMMLMAASPGGRGGANVLKTTKDLMPYFGGNVIADFSLPIFHENFREEGIVDEAKAKELKEKIQIFQEAI